MKWREKEGKGRGGEGKKEKESKGGRVKRRGGNVRRVDEWEEKGGEV